MSTWDIITGDCFKVMATLPPASARLVFADPPYNIGIDYGDGAHADRLPEVDTADGAATGSRWRRGC